MDRAELEARAERALRRGELKEALDVYSALARSFPGDLRLRERVTDLEQSLQPAELARPGTDPPRSAGREPEWAASTPEQEGERLFSLGDYAGAAAAYRRALQSRPDSELVRERLEELYRLARSTSSRPAASTRAEPVDRTALLQGLLERIAARRRGQARGG